MRGDGKESVSCASGAVASARFKAGAGHALAKASLLEEIQLDTADETVEEVVGLVGEANENVGDDRRGPGFEISPTDLVEVMALAAELPHEEGVA